ncbi:M23 family metallopeptidase [Lihuaxuella thermophila]|uniref:Copper amine oxidase N-terminal domain-containing protein n=1 Tax=Lihuaxuella thermophila TaxID=1173111 RepID=A0A1H8DJJ4_9BACL|nr:peptidoglycan DD-metalloendopeptidase family protein [Lihuaxuella thermophila]SEN07449.1 Copper amine oxidase N-terminal domain-containing protein [Lihuaxuella thermophila]
MSRPSLLIVTALLTVLIVFLPPSNKAWLYKWESLLEPGTEPSRMNRIADPPERGSERTEQDRNKINSQKPANERVASTPGAEKNEWVPLTTLSRRNVFYVSLEEVKKRLHVGAKVDREDGEIFLSFGTTTFQLLQDVPVVNINGIYAPLQAAPLIEDGQVWLPVSMIQNLLGQKISGSGEKAFWKGDPTAVPAFAPQKRLPRMAVSQMADYLSFLQTPIAGAHVSTKTSHLPGAPRAYRNGIHEGIDWYSYGTGVKITKKTPVLSMADGIIVRADHDYKEMTVRERQRLLARGVKNDGQTPAYILDKLRGRSVWIQYDKGVMARYVHLDRISGKVRAGQRIKAGEIIGYAGNSGTSDGAKGTGNGVHLHLDIFIYGDWFWKNYSMAERREILEQIFNQTKNR